MISTIIADRSRYRYFLRRFAIFNLFKKVTDIIEEIVIVRLRFPIVLVLVQKTRVLTGI